MDDYDRSENHHGSQAADSSKRDRSPSPTWSFEHTTPLDGPRRSNIPRPSLFSNGSPSNSAMRTPLLQADDADTGLSQLSRPPTIPRKLPTLSASSASGEPATSASDDEVRATISRRRLPRVEKDADDPSSPVTSPRDLTRQKSTTSTTLSRLFAVQTVTSPVNSRSPSYSIQQIIQPRLYPVEAASLPDHLFSRGLLSGRHSDVTVNAFGYGYRLHRLILDRAAFFETAFSGQWLESNAKEISLHPEDLDSNITQVCFELALKRLYGASTVEEEDAEAVGLFATGCWLEMPDLIDSSIESMLRLMTNENLSSLVKLVTNNYYGRAGDKILASAKAMLCRDGWQMRIKCWDGIPGDITREIVGGDGFFIDSEWDRWVLAKRLLDRRLRLAAIDAGLMTPGTKKPTVKAPDTANLMAVRFDAVYRRNSTNNGRGTPESLHRWISLYTHPDVEPLLVLIDEGIHYVHLDFEHLQYIRSATDIFGLPIMPEKVISNALWMQMELRQKVLNAKDTDMELNLSQPTEDRSFQSPVSRETTMAILDPQHPNKGKNRASIHSEVIEDAEEDIASNSWDGNGKPRKFWIPSADCNIVMGGNADPVIATSSVTNTQRHTSRLSATINPEDVQWAADFGAASADTRPFNMRPGSAAGSNVSEMRPIAYSHFPPFRFAAEFPNPRVLKEKKRVYSRTIFYAGSLWNIYIQKVRSSKNPQLGVYLHRAKERETEEVIAGTAGLAQGSVDERIGLLEREMLMRADRLASQRRRRRARQAALAEGHGEMEPGDSSGSADPDVPLVPGENVSRSTIRGLVAPGPEYRKSGQTDILSSTPPDAGLGDGRHSAGNNSSDDEDEDEDPELAKLSRTYRIPTLPPYVDARPTIKTYFKIYSPSKGGRMLSVYESAPDRFNFSQSWGWKSSTLMLDEGILAEESERGDDGEVTGEVVARRDGKLRFMVVIGNI